MATATVKHPRPSASGEDTPGELAMDALLRAARVLVVDDQPANVALLTRIVKSMGIDRVDGVTDPTQALARCTDIGADLVLLDLHMPQMDGFAVLAALRASMDEHAYLPVVVLTADRDKAVRDRALAAGANDFLTKPFDLAEVTLRVYNQLHTRALYADVQRRNAALRANLERQEAEARRLARAREAADARIDKALSAEALSMVFQPIVNLSTREVVGVEALARFAGPPRRPPNEWFDEAAAVGRGLDLELAACRRAAAHLDQLPPNDFLSLNISSATAVSAELLEFLNDLPAAHCVVLELTEHTPVEDYEVLLPALEVLRGRGVRAAVDDAGAGYAGLHHMLRLRPDILKLDIALTRGIDGDPARRALTTGLVAFAQEIGAALIAEGIETGAELEALLGLGVTLGQGYHLARPGPLPVAAICR